jgi:hypothetical protein
MSDEVAAALLTLLGVALAGVVQWLVTRHTVRAETRRGRHQLFLEFHREQFSEWQSKFRDTVADLLAAADPELGVRADKARLIPLVLRAQLMLDPNLQEHARVNTAIGRLALAVNGWHECSESEILGLHSELLEAARAAMYLPEKYLQQLPSDLR